MLSASGLELRRSTVGLQSEAEGTNPFDVFCMGPLVAGERGDQRRRAFGAPQPLPLLHLNAKIGRKRAHPAGAPQRRFQVCCGWRGLECWCAMWVASVNDLKGVYILFCGPAGDAVPAAGTLQEFALTRGAYRALCARCAKSWLSFGFESACASYLRIRWPPSRTLSVPLRLLIRPYCTATTPVLWCTLPPPPWPVPPILH